VLNEAGVGGGYVEEEGEEADGKRKYYRKIATFDVTEEPKKLQVRFVAPAFFARALRTRAESLRTACAQDVLEKAFNSLAMKAVIDPPAAEDSEMANWIEQLKELPMLHFD